MEKKKETLAELTERALAAQNVARPVTALTKTYLESLPGEQLDILEFIIFGQIGFDSREEIIKRLEGKRPPADRLEMMEALLEIVKKI